MKDIENNKDIGRLFSDFVDLKTVKLSQNIKDNIANDLIDSFKNDLIINGNFMNLNVIDKAAVCEAAKWLSEEDHVRFAFDNRNIKDVKSTEEIGEAFANAAAVGYSLDADASEVLSEIYRRENNKADHLVSNPKVIEAKSKPKKQKDRETGIEM